MERFGIAEPIKLASNENPLGPSPQALKAIDSIKKSSHIYPDPDATDLRKAAAAFFKCGPEQIISGNGSDEVIDLICRAYLEPGDEVIIPECTFSYYRIASLACGAHVITTSMKEQSIDVTDMGKHICEKTKIVFVANPNNPTGTYLNKDEVLRLAAMVPEHTMLVIDEAYAAFVRGEDFQSAVGLIETNSHVVTIHTLSKSHGLAGLRVGFGIADESVIQNLYRIKPPFNVNIVALKAGQAALQDRAFLEQTLKNNWEELDYIYSEVNRLGLDYVPSQTNFVLIHIGPDAQSVYEQLLARGIITRFMAGYNLDEYIRVSIGLPDENRAFIANLEEVL
jgi:histidinol-phosphate aminotransferase